MPTLKRSLVPLALACVAAFSVGCATHQIRLAPWRGIPADEAALLQRGQFKADPASLLDAAAVTLEHEPYLHWDIDQLDRADGFVKASAGLFREVQLRVNRDPATPALSSLSVSVPRRELKTVVKVWIHPDGSISAYEPPATERKQCRVLSADVTLDDRYFCAFTWHALHDRTEVPFDLVAYGDPAPAAPLALQSVAPQALSPGASVVSPAAALPASSSAAAQPLSPATETH